MADLFSRRRALAGGIGLAAAMATTTVPFPLSAVARADAAGVLVEPSELPWAEARTIVAETTVPTFPPTTVNARDHGAVADGSTDNTAAFARAINAANAAGGGT